MYFVVTNLNKWKWDWLIVWVSEILRGTLVGVDWSFDNLCRSHVLSHWILILKITNCLSQFVKNFCSWTTAFFKWVPWMTNFIKICHSWAETFSGPKPFSLIFSLADNFLCKLWTVILNERNVIWSAVFEIKWRYDPRTCWTIA